MLNRENRDLSQQIFYRPLGGAFYPVAQNCLHPMKTKSFHLCLNMGYKSFGDKMGKQLLLRCKTLRLRLHYGGRYNKNTFNDFFN